MMSHSHIEIPAALYAAYTSSSAAVASAPVMPRNSQPSIPPSGTCVLPIGVGLPPARFRGPLEEKRYDGLCKCGPYEGSNDCNARQPPLRLCRE